MTPETSWYISKKKKVYCVTWANFLLLNIWLQKNILLVIWHLMCTLSGEHLQNGNITDIMHLKEPIIKMKHGEASTWVASRSHFSSHLFCFFLLFLLIRQSMNCIKSVPIHKYVTLWTNNLGTWEKGNGHTSNQPNLAVSNHGYSPIPKGKRRTDVKNSQRAFPYFLTHRNSSHTTWQSLSCVLRIVPFHLSFVLIRAGNGFTEGEHKERRNEGVERANCRANFKTHTLSEKLLQAVHDCEYKLSVIYCLLSSFQRPYVMRSSTPANEILQTFHKVLPTYPAAWSLEMKSLLRKVKKWDMHNEQYAVGFISPFHTILPPSPSLGYKTNQQWQNTVRNINILEKVSHWNRHLRM